MDDPISLLFIPKMYKPLQEFSCMGEEQDAPWIADQAITVLMWKTPVCPDQLLPKNLSLHNMEAGDQATNVSGHMDQHMREAEKGIG